MTFKNEAENISFRKSGKVFEPHGEHYRRGEISRRAARLGRSSFSQDAYYRSLESCFDYERASPETIASICSAPDGLSNSASYAMNVWEPKATAVEPAVYVIQVGDLPVCKIGVSHNPLQRIQQLQDAHWTELTLHALFWAIDRRAETVEQNALRAAAEMGVRLRGEWVAMEPQDAAILVAKAGRYSKALLADGSTFMDNWKARLTGLAQETRGIERRNKAA